MKNTTKLSELVKCNERFLRDNSAGRILVFGKNHKDNLNMLYNLVQDDKIEMKKLTEIVGSYKKENISLKRKIDICYLIS